MMHKDINHSQNILQGCEAPLPLNNYTESSVKEEIKDEVIESDEGQGVEDSKLDTDNPFDCSEFVELQLHLKN
jgi:hypothetical protein